LKVLKSDWLYSGRNWQIQRVKNQKLLLESIFAADLPDLLIQCPRHREF